MKNSQATPEEKKSASFDEIIKYNAHGRRLELYFYYLLISVKSFEGYSARKPTKYRQQLG